MIEFACGLAIGLALLIWQRHQIIKRHKGTLQDVYHGYCKPDENGHLGYQRFPDKDQAAFMAYEPGMGMKLHIKYD